MNRREIILTAILSSVLSLVVLMGGVVWLGPAQAAPAPQVAGGNVQYVSVSATAFESVQQNSSYTKNTERQMLTVQGTSYAFTLDRNRFAVPLMLPDRAQLLTMVVSGEDYDSQGEVRVRLKRCQQNQPICVVLSETSSGLGFSGGPFGTPASFLQNEVVNNAFYTYFLELDITALNNSGLRAVRLELVSAGGSPAPVSSQIRWELSGNFIRFPIPGAGWTEVKICTDDLSHLPDPGHYPEVVADNQPPQRLGSNDCYTARGYDIEIMRNPNAYPSSGTYQILR